MIAKGYVAACAAVKLETKDVLMATLDLGSDFNFKPGQWVMVSDGRGNKRPYSIASPPYRGTIELCVKLVENGKMSAYFRTLKKGDMVNLAGPYGVFTMDIPPRLDTAFIATGTGIAPFLAMVPVIFQSGTGRHVWVIFGARTEQDLIRREYFESLETRHKNFHYVPVLSRQDWKGRMGHVQDSIMEAIGSPEGRQAYICGLPKMVEEVAVLLEKNGFGPETVHVEKY